jgi:hypothetical protein
VEDKGIDTSIFWLVILGPTLVGLASAVWYGGSKSSGLWIGVFGVVLLVFAGALQIQQHIWSSRSHSGALSQTERPYISVSSIGFSNVLLEPGPIIIRWEIKNSGLTPATIVEANMTVWFATADNPLPQAPQYVAGDRNLSGVMIAPGEIFQAQLQLKRTLTNKEVKFITDGTSQLYVFGYIKYRDTSQTERARGFIALYKPKNDPRFGMFEYVSEQKPYVYGD